MMFWFEHNLLSPMPPVVPSVGLLENDIISDNSTRSRTSDLVTISLLGTFAIVIPLITSVDSLLVLNRRSLAPRSTTTLHNSFSPSAVYYLRLRQSLFYDKICVFVYLCSILVYDCLLGSFDVASFSVYNRRFLPDKRDSSHRTNLVVGDHVGINLPSPSEVLTSASSPPMYLSTIVSRTSSRMWGLRLEEFWWLQPRVYTGWVSVVSRKSLHPYRYSPILAEIPCRCSCPRICGLSWRQNQGSRSRGTFHLRYRLPSGFRHGRVFLLSFDGRSRLFVLLAGLGVSFRRQNRKKIEIWAWPIRPYD